MRRAARTDKTHAAIRDELRQAGFSVRDTSHVGDGFPDLICAKHRITFMVEVKTPKGRKTAAGRLSAAQIDFQATWKGLVVTAFRTQDVLDAFHLIVKRVGWSA